MSKEMPEHTDHESNSVDPQIMDAFARADADFASPSTSLPPGTPDYDILPHSLRPKPLPRWGEPIRNPLVPAVTPLPGSVTGNIEDSGGGSQRWRSKFAEPEPVGVEKIKWSPRLIGMIAKDVLLNIGKNYTIPKNGTEWTYLIAGGVVNFAIFTAMPPGVDRVARTAISLSLTTGFQTLSSTMHFKKELEIIQNFHGYEMEKRLEVLRKDHASAEAKFRNALGRFAAAGVLTNIGFHFEDQIAQSIHNVTSNLPHEIPSIGVPDVTKLPGAIGEKIPYPDTSSWHAPWDGLKGHMPWDRSEATPSVVENPTAVATPAPQETALPTRGVTAVPKPSATAIPGATAPGEGPPPPAPRIPNPGETAPAFHDGASAVDDLKVVMHDGQISDADFIKVLEHQGVDSKLQQTISAQVGKHFNLIDSFKDEADKLQSQHDLEAYANKVFKNQIMESLNKGESLDVATQKAADIYNSSVDSMLKFQPALALEVEKHLDLTRQAVDGALRFNNLPASQLSTTQYEEIRQTVQQVVQEDAVSVYGNELYRGMQSGVAISVDEVLKNGSSKFETLVNSKSEHDFLVGVAHQNLIDHLKLDTQIHSQVNAEITSQFPAGFKEIPIPDHSDISTELVKHGHNIGWNPGQPHYLETVNLFEAEAAVKYDELARNYVGAIDAGLVGENAHIPLGFSEIHQIAQQARSGDAEAMRKLAEILHYWRAGRPFPNLTTEQITKINQILAATGK